MARHCPCSGCATAARPTAGVSRFTLASRDGYEDAILPSGYPVGTPEEALDCACGLYLNDPTAWI
jgi:hypothetical protein